MRGSIVPAQITTVEDKLIGNISILQAVLLGLPSIIGFTISLALPPTGRFVAYKIFIVLGLLMTCGILAVRIKDRIIAQWLKLLIVYFLRPRYHIYDKNSLYLRDTDDPFSKPTKIASTTQARPVTIVNISPKEFNRLENIANNVRAEMKFKVGKKGNLNVQITEIE